MRKYCGVYKKKVYELDIDDGRLEISSDDIVEKKNGFSEYVDVLGKTHSDIFVKEVTLDELEMAYELQINAIYSGKEFETGGIGLFCIEKNEIVLFSMEKEDVEDYGFEKEEQFVFKKDVKLDDIDALVEIKKPILKFKGEPISRKVIPKNSIKEYIKRLG